MFPQSSRFNNIKSIFFFLILTIYVEYFVCVCIHTQTIPYIYIYIYTHTFTHTYTYTTTHTHTQTHTYTEQRRADTFLAHYNILHNEEGIKRNGQLLSAEQAVCYLCSNLERYHLEGGLLHLRTTVINDSQDCPLTRRNSSSFMSQISSRISRLSFYIMRGRFLYTHSSQCPYRKKSGIVWSGDRTGHWIPDIYENGFRRSLTRYILHRSIVIEEVSK